jgi:hypothetical protein
VTHDAQGGGDGGAAAHQEGADEQEQGCASGRLGKEWLKLHEQGYNGLRQGHRGPWSTMG